MASHHLARFGGHWSSASGNIKKFIFHMTSQNSVIEGSCNFMSGRTSLHVNTLPSLRTIGIMVAEVYF